MKCSRCKQKAVADLKYANQQLCERHFCELLEKRVRRAIKNNKMLEMKDKVGVGVSGGKDSLVLLFLLSQKLHYKPVAITIDEGIKGYRNKSIIFAKEFCKKHGIPLKIFSFKKEFGFTLDQLAKKTKKPPCSYCGVLRRALLNRAAKRLGCSKLATAHNLDDECQTILMNFLRGEWQRMARGGPVVAFVKHESFVPRVKPMRECLEREDVLYALLNKIEYEDAECPYAHDAYRNAARETINTLERDYPNTKFALLASVDRMLPFLQEHFSKKQALQFCGECGDVAARSTCNACQTTQEAKRLL